LTLSAAVALVLWSCDSQPDVPLPPPSAMPPAQAPPPMTPPGMPQAPGAQPPGMQPPGMPGATPPTPVAEAPLPRTELIPISDEVEEEPAPKKIPKGGTGICRLPGPETPGDELLGNYTCDFDIKGLPFGLKPPAVGCSIRKKSDGTLKVKRTGGEAGSFGGPITETKAGGFRVDGKYKFGGNKLTVGTCMKRKGAGKFVGSGSGVLNGDKKNKLKYKLTMTKQ
jgi:hypothetical protein